MLSAPRSRHREPGAWTQSPGTGQPDRQIYSCWSSERLKGCPPLWPCQRPWLLTHTASSVLATAHRRVQRTLDAGRPPVRVVAVRQEVWVADAPAQRVAWTNQPVALNRMLCAKLDPLIDCIDCDHFQHLFRDDAGCAKLKYVQDVVYSAVLSCCLGSLALAASGGDAMAASEKQQGHRSAKVFRTGGGGSASRTFSSDHIRLQTLVPIACSHGRANRQ